MDYQQTIDFLYSQTPMFQQIGAAAYKPGLDTVAALSDAFGNPHKQLKTIHVGGTNGKGSTAHSIAAVLQAAGYKVGLFTSPHLIDFRERIRVDGRMIPHEEVVEFVEKFRRKSRLPRPSFFELTTVMAFDWFARSGVDYAVIEVGLGGRLDSTNIITPLLSVITNISFDHTAQLGNRLETIAMEKAGIIKAGVPVVIGEADGAVRGVFENKAASESAPIVFAEDEKLIELDSDISRETTTGVSASTKPFGDVHLGLSGIYQRKNLATVCAALAELRKLGVEFDDEDVREGLANVMSLTGLTGRWMTYATSPLIICDTGHNEGGWRYISEQLRELPGEKIMVLGFVNDKDVSHILPLIPDDARIIYTQASVRRAMAAEMLAELGAQLHRPGRVAADVATAVTEARRMARQLKSDSDTPEPVIFVGGSTFVVADLLALEEQGIHS